MQKQIITIYCLCADFLALYRQKDDPQAQMPPAGEVYQWALQLRLYLRGVNLPSLPYRSNLFLAVQHSVAAPPNQRSRE